MKKIITILRPTFLRQTIFVYDNGNKIDTRHPTADEISKEMFELTKEYGINDIDLYGPKQYSEGIKNQIQKFELSKYNKNILNINCK